MADQEPAIDPALWAEFQQISDRVHQLHVQRDIEETTPPPPSYRLMLDVPEEWALLFTWISRRTIALKTGRYGPTGLTPELFDQIGISRQIVRGYMEWVLSEHFVDMLHDLCTGRSSLLYPEPPPSPKPERTASSSGWAADGDGDLDDDIPF